MNNRDSKNKESLFNFSPLTKIILSKGLEEQEICEQLEKLMREEPIKPIKNELSTAVSENLIEVVKLLLKAGANINATDSVKATALHYAAQSGSTDMILLLYFHGADLNAVDKNGETCLHWAVKNNQFDVIKTLRTLDNPIDASIKNKSGKMANEVELKSSGYPQKIKLKQSFSHSNEFKIPLLHLAVVNNDITEVKKLLKLGAPVNQVDEDGRAAIHYAVECDNPEILNLLCNHVETNINLRDKEGNTALHISARHSSKCMTTIMNSPNHIKTGIRNNEGKTAYDILNIGFNNNENEQLKLLETFPNLNTPEKNQFEGFLHYKIDKKEILKSHESQETEYETTHSKKSTNSFSDSIKNVLASRNLARFIELTNGLTQENCNEIKKLIEDEMKTMPNSDFINFIKTLELLLVEKAKNKKKIFDFKFKIEEKSLQKEILNLFKKNGTDPGKPLEFENNNEQCVYEICNLRVTEVATNSDKFRIMVLGLLRSYEPKEIVTTLTPLYSKMDYNQRLNGAQLIKEIIRLSHEFGYNLGENPFSDKMKIFMDHFNEEAIKEILDHLMKLHIELESDPVLSLYGQIREIASSYPDQHLENIFTKVTATIHAKPYDPAALSELAKIIADDLSCMSIRFHQTHALKEHKEEQHAKTNNQLQQLIQSQILNQKNIIARARLISLFIQTAKECISGPLPDFDKMATIIGTLNLNSISRLTDTFSLIDKQILNDFNQLNDVLKPTGNFRNYRSKINASETALPFLMVIAKDSDYFKECGYPKEQLEMSGVGYNSMSKVKNLFEFFIPAYSSDLSHHLANASEMTVEEEDRLSYEAQFYINFTLPSNSLLSIESFYKGLNTIKQYNLPLNVKCKDKLYEGNKAIEQIEIWLNAMVKIKSIDKPTKEEIILHCKKVVTSHSEHHLSLKKNSSTLYHENAISKKGILSEKKALERSRRKSAIRFGQECT